MTQFVVTYDNVAATCSLATLTPYPTVSSSDGSVTVAASVDPVSGQTTFNVTTPPTVVDVNVDNFTYDPATKIITLTETDGTAHPIDVSDLVDAGSTSAVTNTLAAGNRIATHSDGDGNVVNINETVTSLASNGDGSFKHTNEAGVETDLSLCVMLADLPTSPTPIGG